jgi:membrane protein DedA with SNARE-associated domain
MDLGPHLEFLADHPYAVVFWSSLVEAIGIPFPSRVILILTPAFLATDSDLVRLVAMASLGAVLGDHVPYLAGRLAGLRLLSFYCTVTLASDRCVERTLGHFARWGPATLLVSRFSTSVRLFASACAGCSALTYPRYLTLDVIGTVLYTSLWVIVGAFIGERAVEFFTTDRRRYVVVTVVVLAGLTLIGYRMWRRLRYGRARASRLGTSGETE